MATTYAPLIIVEQALVLYRQHNQNQCGMRPSSLSAKVSEAKMNKRQTLNEKRLNHLLSRVSQFLDGINNDVIQHTKKVIAFENKRKQFLLSRYKRFFQIIELFIKKQYSLYADGWRSAVKDMLAK